MDLVDSPPEEQHPESVCQLVSHQVGAKRLAEGEEKGEVRGESYEEENDAVSEIAGLNYLPDRGVTGGEARRQEEQPEERVCSFSDDGQFLMGARG